MIVALIMAGGKGERFWPKSRKSTPKQFLDLTGTGTMIQQTIQRLQPLIDKDKVFVVTGSEYEELTRAQLPDLPQENIIIEPMGRDTAACIGYATLFIAKKFPQATMVVLPADQLVTEEDEFRETLTIAVNRADEEGGVVTIGISPTRPETGYGYIKVGRVDSEVKDNKLFVVDKFVEKPDLPTAKSYIKSRKYVWNSGMFVWKVTTIQALIKEFMPELDFRLETIKDLLEKDEKYDLVIDEFAKIPKVSIDYGVMEKASRVYVIPGFFGWDDVGSWLALERVNPYDAQGNVVFGNLVSMDTKDCIVDSPKKMVATIGLNNLVIVDTEDVLLVCEKGRTQDIKKLLELFRMEKLESYL